MSAEFRGRWVKRGGIMVPVVDEPKPGGRPRTVVPGPVGVMLDGVVWTPESLRAAHAAYVRGVRDVVTVAGHREWDRRRKEDVRLGRRMSGVDRGWCERQVVEWSWLVDERTNRAASMSSIN